MEIKLSKSDRLTIGQTIKDVEAKTYGEIVPVLLRRSDTYPAAHFRCAIFLGLVLSFAFYYFPFYEAPDSLYYLWFMMGGMVIGYYLCFFPRVKRFFLSKREIAEEVHQRAVEIFFHKGIHVTKERIGILLFISVLEHRAEIIADCGINEVVEKEAWDVILRKMLQGLKRGEHLESITAAVKECGELLEKNFPKVSEASTNENLLADNSKYNELSNKIITDDEQTEDNGKE